MSRLAILTGRHKIQSSNFQAISCFYDFVSDRDMKLKNYRIIEIMKRRRRSVASFVYNTKCKFHLINPEKKSGETKFIFPLYGQTLL